MQEMEVGVFRERFQNSKAFVFVQFEHTLTDTLLCAIGFKCLETINKFAVGSCCVLANVLTVWPNGVMIVFFLAVIF